MKVSLGLASLWIPRPTTRAPSPATATAGFGRQQMASEWGTVDREACGEGRAGPASPPCVAAACFSCAVVVAPPAVTWIHALDHRGIRGGSLGWLRANPPFLLQGEKILSQCLYSSGGSDTYYLIFSPSSIKEVWLFCPRGDGISAGGKAAPLGFSRIKCSGIELSLPKEKAPEVLSESCEAVSIVLVVRLQCLECGFLGICDVKTGKGCSPPPQQIHSDLCEFTYKYFTALKVVAKSFYHVSNPQPAFLTNCPRFPAGFVGRVATRRGHFRSTGSRETLERVSLWKGASADAQSPGLCHLGYFQFLFETKNHRRAVRWQLCIWWKWEFQILC